MVVLDGVLKLEEPLFDEISKEVPDRPFSLGYTSGDCRKALRFKQIYEDSSQTIKTHLDFR